VSRQRPGRITRFTFANEHFDIDVAVQGPLPAPPTAPTDCVICRLPRRPNTDRMRHIDLGAEAQPGYLLGRDAETHYIVLADYAVLAISDDGGSVGYWVSAEIDDAYVSHLVLDHALPTRLGVMGRTALHGTAVAIGCVAVAFVGPTGNGKSTLAAGFAGAGFPLLADDCLVVERREGRQWVVPTYPGTRLAADALRHLQDGMAEHLVPISVDYPKYLLTPDNTAFRFSDETLPLAAIIFVARARIKRPRMQRVEPMDALTRLLGQSWYTEATGADLIDLIDRTGALVDDVATHELVSTRVIGQLADSRQLVIDTIHALPQ